MCVLGKCGHQVIVTEYCKEMEWFFMRIFFLRLHFCMSSILIKPLHFYFYFFFPFYVFHWGFILVLEWEYFRNIRLQQNNNENWNMIFKNYALGSTRLWSLPIKKYGVCLSEVYVIAHHSLFFFVLFYIVHKWYLCRISQSSTHKKWKFFFIRSILFYAIRRA